MTATTHGKKIDALMEKASTALADTRYFEAEALADKALSQARQASDFGRMARIVLPLQEARRQRLQRALDTEEVVFWDEPVTEDTEVEPGCYLIEPPLVGADARRLRLAALDQRVPVAVVCREPLTMTKLCPVVAIGPGLTLRTKIDPPEDPDAPDMAWFVGAIEQLGDFAVDSIDPGLAVLKRLDALLARLSILPEHERLHQALADTCREAERDAAETASTAATGKGRR